MRFYTQAHQHYCGIDLHGKTMYVCIVNQQGDMLLHRNINTDGEQFLALVDLFRQDLVDAVAEISGHPLIGAAEISGHLSIGAAKPA